MYAINIKHAIKYANRRHFYHFAFDTAITFKPEQFSEKFTLRALINLPCLL